MRSELGVTCSIGVAPNRMLAKVWARCSCLFGGIRKACNGHAWVSITSCVPASTRRDWHRRRRMYCPPWKGLVALLQVCADRNKPDGQFVLPGQTDAVARFVDALPIRKVPGIGKVRQSGFSRAVSACLVHMDQMKLCQQYICSLLLPALTTASLAVDAVGSPKTHTCTWC